MAPSEIAISAEKGSNSQQTSQIHHPYPEIPLDFEDPHRAALEHDPISTEKPSLGTVLAVIALALSYVSPISLGYILPASVLVSIQTSLGDTENKITWLIGGWSVASSVSFAIAGSFSDVFGRRWTIMSGQVICIVGSIVAATASNVDAIIVGSTLLGFGCGIIFVSYAGISELLPNRWRQVAVGIGLAATEVAITIPWVIPSVLIATLFVLHTDLGWRWLYHMGTMFGVISLIGTYVFYWPPTRPQYDFERSRWEQFKSIDFVGCFLYATGLTSFLVGLTWAGQPGQPWNGASVIAPIVIGALTFISSFVYDWFIATAPLFPNEVLREVRSFTVLLGVSLVAGMVYYPMSALLPQGSLYMFTNDAMEIGYIALPNGAAQFVFGAVAPSLVGKIKHLKWQIVIALVAQTAFTTALVGVIPDNKAGWMALQAFSIGPFIWAVIVCYIIAGLNLPLRYMGTASGLIGTFRSMGGSIGNAIFNTIIRSVVTDKLGNSITDAALGVGFNPDGLSALIPATRLAVVGVPGAFSEVPGINPTVEQAAVNAFRHVHAKAFSMVFYATVPFGVIAIIMACFINDPSKYLTGHTAVRMEKEIGQKRDTKAHDIPKEQVA
ncbi:hypothetical protein HJFPF1_07181 [Paramyrothecium foliicola]|nr:hypothetical protein HJFPF1_07181 [Paramyrothecium foliicola]